MQDWLAICGWVPTSIPSLVSSNEYLPKVEIGQISKEDYIRPLNISTCIHTVISRPWIHTSIIHLGIHTSNYTSSPPIWNISGASNMLTISVKISFRTGYTLSFAMIKWPPGGFDWVITPVGSAYGKDGVLVICTVVRHVGLGRNLQWKRSCVWDMQVKAVELVVTHSTDDSSQRTYREEVLTRLDHDASIWKHRTVWYQYVRSYKQRWGVGWVVCNQLSQSL